MIKIVRKYDYWHVITKVSKEYTKKNKQIKIGTCITLQYKHNYDNSKINLFDLKNGKEIKGAYFVSYLIRIDVDIKKDIKIKLLKEALNNWKKKQKVIKENV